MQVAGAVVMLVDVDEAVALAQLAGAGGDDVDGAPPGVADDIGAIFLNGCLQCVVVRLQVVGAVRVVDPLHAVLDDDLVIGAKAVLHHHLRDVVVALGHGVDGPTQADRVDLPAPVARLEVGVLAAQAHVAGNFLAVIVRGGGHGHVVAVREHVHGALGQDLLVARQDVGLGSVLLPDALGVVRISAAHLHVRGVPVAVVQLLLGQQQVGRVAGQRVGGQEGRHVAHHDLGIVVMRVLDRLGAGQELVMQRVETGLGVTRRIGGGAGVALHEAGGQRVVHERHAGVDLVEGQPVLHLVMPAVEAEGGVGQEEVDAAAVGPCVVLLDQAVRGLVVGQSHERLDAVFLEAGEDLVIELDAGGQRLGLLARGEQARPVDGHAEDVPAHLGKELDVLLVVAIEVRGLPAGIEGVGVELFVNLTRGGCRRTAHVVAEAVALATHVPGALVLVSSGSATPQKALRKCHSCPSLLLIWVCFPSLGLKLSAYKSIQVYGARAALP